MHKEILSFWESNSGWIISAGEKLLIAFIILVSAPFIVKLVKNSILKASQKFKKIDKNIVPILSTIATYIIYAIVVIMLFDVFGINTSSLIAILGTAGLAIALALKDTLGQVAAGFMLLMQRNFVVGDYIGCGSIEGTVMEVNLFVTKLKTPDGLLIAAPNNNIWGCNIINYSCHKNRRITIKVGISYADSADKAMKTLMKLSEDPRFLKDPAPQVALSGFLDNSVEIMFRGWVKSGDYWQTLWDNNKKAKELVEKAGITIPFPQLDVHLSKEDK